jgi:hypothetical protein
LLSSYIYDGQNTPKLRKMKMIVGFLLALSGSLMYSSKIIAQGNLIIIPRRVVFEDNKRIQELNLANTGTDTAKYLISVIQYRMKDDGTFENIAIPDSGQSFADKNFRFFPRSVVLAPNEAQTIKVQLINTSELKPGEYRSHLYFRSVPNASPLGEKDTLKVSKSISVHLVPIFGIAIPVIIRTGVSNTMVTLSSASLEINTNEAHKLKLAFFRTGNMSVYGDIKVDYISLQGKITQVGIAKGFAIYTPNPGRHFALSLDNNQNVNYHKGKLHIVYTTPSDVKFAKIAETELELL